MLVYLQEEWLTIISIFLSGIISWIISAVYFYKGNRGNLQMSVLFPILDILSETVSRKNYIEIKELSRSYLTRFLSNNEKRKLYNLIKAYRFICGYNENSAYATAIVSDFENRLKRNNINPRIVPIEIDGEVVEYDYPDEINYLHVDIQRVLDEYCWETESEECKEQILLHLTTFAKEFYTTDNIELFKDYELGFIIKNALITDKWKWKFERYEEAKREFEKLRIVKELLALKNVD